MQFIYRRCGSAPTHLMRCCILASGVVRCNDVLYIFYFFILNGLAMRSGPKGIAYRCCCTLAFLFFGSAKAYSLASFGLSDLPMCIGVVVRWLFFFSGRQRHTLWQVLVAAWAGANCKCVWLLAMALFRYYSVLFKILCLFKYVFIYFVSFYWRISVFVQENY